METTTHVNKNQFDLSHWQVDKKLQGARLSSFSRRMTAYLIDWAIILACMEFLWLLLPLALVFLIVRKKLLRTMATGRHLIKKNVLLADQTLESMHIDKALRRRFNRYMVVYMYILMYTPLVLAGMLLLGYLFNLFFPKTYDTASLHLASFFGLLFQPITTLNNAVGLLIKFFSAFAYFTIFTWKWKGQTPGKRLMHIKAVKLNGKPITFWGSLDRASGYTASTALLLYGFFQYFWDRNRQTTHDKITETIVIDC